MKPILAETELDGSLKFMFKFFVCFLVAYMLDVSRVNSRTVSLLQEASHMLIFFKCDSLKPQTSCAFCTNTWHRRIFFQNTDSRFLYGFELPNFILSDQGRVTPDTRRFGHNLVRSLVTPHILRRIMKHGIQNFVKNKARCYLGKNWPR
jgi:hypothetical protein